MIENYTIHDFVGNVGVIVILVTYYHLQVEKISTKDITFSLLNASGSLLIIYSLFFKFNVSSVLIETCWLLISLFGIFKNLMARRKDGARKGT